MPLLLLRGQAWGSPVRLAAAVDVSDDDHTDLARGILHAAGFLALGMHARLDVLYSEVEMHDESLRMERAVKLARLVREFHWVANVSRFFPDIRATLRPCSPRAITACWCSAADRGGKAGRDWRAAP